MGISNFTFLVQSAGLKPSREPRYFDSILIDIQSVIHSQIYVSLKSKRDDIIREVCQGVVGWVRRTVKTFLTNNPHSPEVTVIISFDGAGVPMKWCVQADRRKKDRRTGEATSDVGDKEILKQALFEHNSTSREVFTRLERDVSERPLEWDLPGYCYKELKFVLSGSHCPGEGEHKLFRLAQTYRCREPLVVSVDNDVFVIALLRRENFREMQVVKSETTIYSLGTVFGNSYGKSKTDVLLLVSFLFGNDFVPEIVGLRRNNVLRIHEAVSQIAEECGDVVDCWDRAPEILHSFLCRMEPHLSFRRFDDYLDELMTEFWKNCLWMASYYSENDHFPQKYMRNRLWEIFDRDRFLTAAVDDPEHVRRTYENARSEYTVLRTEPPLDREQTLDVVFSSDKERVKPFLLPETGEESVVEITWEKTARTRGRTTVPQGKRRQRRPPTRQSTGSSCTSSED